MKGLIPYAATERQAEILRLRIEGKSWEAVAAETGMDPANGRKIISKIKRRAAKAGYSPEHDMTHTDPMME